MSTKKLRLSKEARSQLKRIGQYTEERWGEQQRSIYLAKLDEGIERIRAKPGIGKRRDDLYPGMLCYRIEHYYVYYYDFGQEILVAGILHTKMDPKRHL